MPNLHRRTRRDKLFRRVASRDVYWVLHLFVRVVNNIWTSSVHLIQHE